MSLRFLTVGCLACMLGGCGYLFGDSGFFPRSFR